MDAVKKVKKEKAPKPKYNMWQNSCYMISLAWKHQKSILFLALITVVLALASNLINLFISPAILGAVESSAPLGELIRTILIFTLAMMIVGGLDAYVNQNTLFSKVALRLSFVAWINEKLAMTSYPNTESQDLKKKLEKAKQSVNNNRAATEAIWGTLSGLLRNIAGFIIYLLLLSSLDPILIAVTVITSLVGFFVNKYINGWGYRHREEEAEYSHRIDYITDKAGDHTIAKDIRIFGMRDWLEGILDSSMNLYLSFIAQGEKVYIWANVVDVLLSFLRNGVAYLYLINMVLDNGLSASQFLLYFSAIGGFTSWVTGILGDFSTLHSQSLDLSNVREFLEYDEIFKFEDGELLEPQPDKSYEIELKNVSFRYPEADSDTLKNINLKIKPGEKIAVVGLNGAGKTTLVKLICGFYDPTEGEVLLNGRNIKEFNRRDYYRHFSAVFQNFSLLATTVGENITQDASDVDIKKLNNCVEKAGLTKKISSLPSGYETHYSREVFEDGIELSGGETQRLMLARALYKDAPIIILDEPTAALDPIAESDLYNKYNDLTRGRTSVYISHRLASTRFCDRVIFIDNGDIAEEGTHESLLKQGKKYAELFEIQSRYYREGNGGAENEER